MKKTLHTVGVLMVALMFLVGLTEPRGVEGLVNYPPAALLQPNDITSAMLGPEIVTDAKVSDSAAISATKISGGSNSGLVLLSTGAGTGTSTSLRFATSTTKLYVMGGSVEASSTNFNGVAYTWPATAGANTQVLSTNGSGALWWAASSPANLTFSATAGVALSANDAVFVATSTATTTILNYTVATKSQDWGDVTQDQFAQEFSSTTSFESDRTDIYLREFGSPSDTITVSFQTDNAGSPSGTQLASTTLAGGNLTGIFATSTAVMNKMVTFAANTQYWIVFGRSSASSDTQFYYSEVDGNAGYTGETCKVANGASWTSKSCSAVFSLSFLTTAGSLYRTKTNVKDFWQEYVGLSSAAYSVGAAATINVAGVMTASTTFTPGQSYFLGDSTGSIGPAAGTNSQKVGRAISTTQIILTPQ